MVTNQGGVARGLYGEDDVDAVHQRINELVRGKRGVTPETAWLLGQALDTTPEFWLNLQAAYDLATSRPAKKVRPLKRAS